MREIFKNDKTIIFFLIVIFFMFLPFFYLKQGLLLIDTGREFFIPEQMLYGNCLYKDIYNIYGALSYQINMYLMLFFGQKINVLYNAGCFNSLLIIITLFLLAREFLKKSYSFLFAILMMFALVFQTFLYNSNLTYCFAIVYALSAFLISVLFLVKFIKTDNIKMAYCSCLFAGISIANKYEFSLYLLILLYVFCFMQPIGINKFIKSVLFFLLFPAISLSLLMYNGLNLYDIKENIILTQNLINAPLVKLFFNKTGVFFNTSYLLGLIKNNGIMTIFAVIPILNLILFAIKFKKIYENKSLFVFILCAIAASAKSCLYLNINHMGLFIFPISLLALLILISKYSARFITIILTACILLFAAEDFSSLKYKNFKLETPKGTIYTYPQEGKIIKTAFDFVKNTNGSYVILPEGCFINYISNNEHFADSKALNPSSYLNKFYYNLSPLFYNDVFGENRIINDFNKNLPDNIIILPIDNIEYESRFFGKDYAQNFFENIIIKNYNLVEEKNGIEFYQRKNI